MTVYLISQYDVHWALSGVYATLFLTLLLGAEGGWEAG